jgi:nitrite reductase/ring-hydroxylating ferredoxin subunit
MLSCEDNEALVRVGPGTAMGALMRLFWIPFYAANELARDGEPHRVRLLGEDLVAWRDSDGRPSLVANACPHRGAPMLYGRNEECGLRCVYHGWEFDVAGGVPPRQAKRMLESLRGYKLLEGFHGRPACLLESVIDTICRFSELAADLADVIEEADVNPIIAGPAGTVATDALFIGL